MSGGPFRWTLRATALAQVQQVDPVRFRNARGSVAAVYQDVEREFGVLAPPVALHSPAPDVMSACWLMLRQSLVAPGLVERSVKEAVATAVSVANSCPFCATVHSSTLDGFQRGAGATAIAEDRLDGVHDPQLRAVASWAADSTVRDLAAEHTPPFPAAHAPEYISTALTFHYLNRMVNIFLPDVPMPTFTPRAALPVVKRVLGTMIRSASRRPMAAAAPVDLLPAAPAAPDLAWAAASPTVSEAFARAVHAVDTAATGVPDSVRDLLRTRLVAWDGRPMGLSRGWVNDAAEAVPAADRPTARLALLTAFASYQVDQDVIDDYRNLAPDDRSLIEVTSWASLAAARHIAAWAPAGQQRAARES